MRYVRKLKRLSEEPDDQTMLKIKRKSSSKAVKGRFVTKCTQKYEFTKSWTDTNAGDTYENQYFKVFQTLSHKTRENLASDGQKVKHAAGANELRGAEYIRVLAVAQVKG